MNQLICVGAGGAIGAMLRFGMAGAVDRLVPGVFPWGTLSVNLAGSLLVGFLAGILELSAVPQEMRLFLTAGILGGFTTFSAFSLENCQLLRGGQPALFAINVTVSVGLGMGLTLAGFLLARLVMNR